MERKILDKINTPQDLSCVTDDELPVLCEEIRDFLIENVTKTGGHLASNLGVVELSVALHRVFSAPEDHIIYDVGHQSYVHKILTGRKDRFDTLRTPGGLSGFTKRSESEYDAFGCGHSSTSLSAAIGFARADLQKGNNAYTVAVIGDGAFTGGMIHEALNNVTENMRLVIIINENEMSISKNTGAFASYMTKIRAKKKYFKIKDKTHNALIKLPLIGRGLVKGIVGTKQFFKNLIYKSNYFEDIGIYYMGPADGNDVNLLTEMLEVDKNLNSSVIVHITTKKGKGYEPAEKMPWAFHGISAEGKTEQNGFTDNFGSVLCDMALEHKDIVAITAAMPDGCGVYGFKQLYPDRYYDVGIAEEHGATFAAGLAANGLKPFFTVYSSFLQRAYDNVLHDIALQNLPVVICVDRAGLNCGDGATHHGIYDVSFLSSIPGIEIFSPATYECQKRCLEYAYYADNPVVIRYPKGCENEDIENAFYRNADTELGIKSNFDGAKKCIIITYGSIAVEALKAEKMLEEKGVSCGTVLLERIRPHREIASLVSQKILPETETLIFLEEGVYNGGCGMCLFDEIRKLNRFNDKRFIIKAVKDGFSAGEQGKSLYRTMEIDAKAVFDSYFEK